MTHVFTADAAMMDSCTRSSIHCDGVATYSRLAARMARFLSQLNLVASRFTAGKKHAVFLVDAMIQGTTSAASFALTVASPTRTQPVGAVQARAAAQATLHLSNDALAQLYGPVLLEAGSLLGCEQRGQRHAAADALSERHDVRLNPGMFVMKQLSGAADAGLYFIDDQQQAMRPCQLAQFAQELVGRGPDAGFALDRLQHHGDGLV